MDDEVIHLTRRQLREERELQQRRESTRRPGSAGSRRTIGLATLRGPLGIALLWLGGHLAAATLFLTRFGTNPDRWNTLIVGEPVAQFAALTQLARLPFERVMTDVPAPPRASCKPCMPSPLATAAGSSSRSSAWRCWRTWPSWPCSGGHDRRGRWRRHTGR